MLGITQHVHIAIRKYIKIYELYNGEKASRQVDNALFTGYQKLESFHLQHLAGGPQWPKLSQKPLKPKQLYDFQMLSVRKACPF